MAKNKDFEPWILCTAAVVLLSAGWLMRSLPVFVFVGIAPLFAIADRASANLKKQSAWNYIELILMALLAMYWASASFSIDRLVISALQAIVIGLVFAAYAFSKTSLNFKPGKWLLIMYWLAAEFVLVSLAPDKFTYLADALALKPDWVRWNQYTGYQGAGLWILVCNLAIFYGLLESKKVRWAPLIFFLIFLALPLWYSFRLHEPAIARGEMVSLYAGRDTTLQTAYGAKGELVSRTASWVSLLILVFSFVKNKVKQK